MCVSGPNPRKGAAQNARPIFTQLQASPKCQAHLYSTSKEPKSRPAFSIIHDPQAQQLPTSSQVITCVNKLADHDTLAMASAELYSKTCSPSRTRKTQKANQSCYSNLEAETRIRPPIWTPIRSALERLSPIPSCCGGLPLVLRRRTDRRHHGIHRKSLRSSPDLKHRIAHSPACSKDGMNTVQRGGSASDIVVSSNAEWQGSAGASTVDVQRQAGADVTVASVDKQLRFDACHSVGIVTDA